MGLGPAVRAPPPVLPPGLDLLKPSRWGPPTPRIGVG